MKSIMEKAEERILLPEDWVVVLVGFMIIFLFVAGIAVPVPTFSWSTTEELITKVFSARNLSRMLLQFLLVFASSVIALVLIRKNLKSFLIAFPLIFLLTVVALILAGNNSVKALNLEAVIFSLLAGLIISNLFTLPVWFRQVLSGELFVKIGLVLLGTTIIFGDIVKAGAVALIQAVIVVLSVWYFAWWLCKKFRLDDELSMMISSAVSICGVSAAIATAGAIQGDTRKLSYVISLVLITAIPMMIGMPLIANYFEFPQEVTGAWLGGSIDTTGAVVASGTLVGDTALKISTIVKFSQNVLLGLAAFAISIYWTYNGSGKGTAQSKQGAGVIWERFPKFVLGFMAASVLFSFVLSSATTGAVKDGLKSIQTLWFVLAFTSIGLETRFRDLLNKDSNKSLAVFLLAQLFNILVTLLVAWVLFS